MSDVAKMTVNEQRKYLRVVRKRYLKASKPERGRLLDEMEASPPLLDQPSKISISTVRRILSRIRQDEPRLPRISSAQANTVAREIPTKSIPWDERQPHREGQDLRTNAYTPTSVSIDLSSKSSYNPLVHELPTCDSLPAPY